MLTLPRTRSCFVCGALNSIGLKLTFQTDGRIVQSRFVPKPEWVGFQQTLHGGIVATILDEVMVWACGVRTKRFVYCAELTVRFSLPVRPGEEVIAVGEMTLNRRNRILETLGQIKDSAGTVLASATGKYIPLRDDEAAKMLPDFLDDPAIAFANLPPLPEDSAGAAPQ